VSGAGLPRVRGALCWAALGAALATSGTALVVAAPADAILTANTATAASLPTSQDDASPPSNDELEDAVALSPNTAVIGSTDLATIVPNEPRQEPKDNHVAVRTVWYSYTPTSTQHVGFATSSVGDNVDTVITLYSGKPGAKALVDLTYLADNDDAGEVLGQVGELAPATWFYSYLAADLAAGTTYYLQVDALDTMVPRGSFAVRVDVAGTSSGWPANDGRADAMRLIPDREAPVNNRNASKEVDEPTQPTCPVINNTVWFRYRPAVSGNVSFGTVGSTDAVLGVYLDPRAGGGGELEPEGCLANSQGDVHQVVSLTAGYYYYVQVGSKARTGSAKPFGVVASPGPAQWGALPSKVTANGTWSDKTVTLAASVAADPGGNQTVLDDVPLRGSVEFLDSTGTSLGSVKVNTNSPNAKLVISSPTTGDHDYLAVFTSSTGDYWDSYRPFSVTVPPPELSVTSEIPTTMSVTYSDPVTASLSATSHVVKGSVLTAETPGLAALGLQLRKVSDSGSAMPGTAQWQVEGTVTAPAREAVYPVSITVSGGGQTKAVTFAVQVSPETATVAYTGPPTAGVEMPGNPNDLVTLKAQVQADDTPGNLAQAGTVTFVDAYNNNAALCTATTTGDGSAECKFRPGLTSGQVRAYRVQARLTGNGYFAAAQSAPADLTVRTFRLDVAQPDNPTQTVQYSDRLALPMTFVAATDRPGPLVVSVLSGGLPAGLILSEGWVFGQQVTGTVTRRQTLAPAGDYAVTYGVTDGVETIDVPLSITVERENATVVADGPWTVEAGDQVELTATVTQESDSGGAASFNTASASTSATFFDLDDPSKVLCTDDTISAAGKASCTFKADKTRRVMVKLGGPLFTGETAQDAELIVPHGLEVSDLPSAVSVDYSDGTPLSFTARSDRSNPRFSASVVGESGLPAGLSLTRTDADGSPDPDADGQASWAITGEATGAPGSPSTVTFRIEEGPNSKEVPVTFEVSQEKASVALDAPASVVAGTPATLTAHLTPENDDYADGDLTGATATFKDRETVLCTDVPVNADGSATCSVTLTADAAVTVVLGGWFTGETSAATPVVITGGLEVTAPPATVSVQYSDIATGLSFEASSLRAGVSVKSATGLPTGLWLERTGTDASASWTLTGAVSDPPRDYPVTLVVTDGFSEKTVEFTVTVTREDATVHYTGPTTAVVGQPVTLAAEVTQDDGSSGDLSTATAQFADASGAKLCTAPVTTSVAGSMTGVATCSWTAESTRAVSVTVEGNYTGETDEAVDLVLTPATGPATGPTTGPETEPDTLLSSGPGAWLPANQASFTFSSTRTGATYSCSLDGAAAAPCSSPYTIGALRPGSHVVTIAATHGSKSDPTPVRSVFTVLEGAKALKAKNTAWTKANGRDAYLGKYWQTRGKGRVLTLKKPVAGAWQLALVGATSPKAGKVKVYVGKKLVGKVNLKGPKSANTVLALTPGTTARSGKVRIVTATGKPVKLAGIGIATTL